MFCAKPVFRAAPLSITPLATTLPLVAAYSGGKEATPAVVHQVQELGKRWPALIGATYEQMERSSLLAAEACRAGDWAKLGQLMNFQQGQMESLGLANLSLATLVHQLRRDAGIFGSKISGAGLGDCVIGLGTLQDPAAMPAAQVMPIAAHGVELI